MLFDSAMIDRLDAQLREILLVLPNDPELYNFSAMPPLHMRATCKALCFPDLGFGSIGATQYLKIPGPDGNTIPTKMYYPKSPLRHRGLPRVPLIIYFHGGGWVSCDIDTHDNFCRALTKISGMLVASIEYRLGPESPFPAAPEDCYAATDWLSKHATTFGGDPSRLIIGGDSAGGNLATVVALMNCERRNFSLLHQLLLYPSTQWEDWYIKGYLAKPEDAKHPWVAPLLASSLRGLPPATIVTAEFDGLNAQIDAYQNKLLADGVSVERLHYTGTIHGFLTTYGGLDHAHQAMEEIGDMLRRVAKHAYDKE